MTTATDIHSPTPAMRAACQQPACNADDAQRPYCLCAVYAGARQRCIDKGEGWRWGVHG